VTIAFSLLVAGMCQRGKGSKKAGGAVNVDEKRELGRAFSIRDSWTSREGGGGGGDIVL